MRRARILLGALALAAALGCGGGAGIPAAPATRLVYTDPTEDRGTWRLVNDPASTDRRLVLDLLAPAGASGPGAVLALTADPSRVLWSPVEPPGAGPGSRQVQARIQGATLHLLVSREPGHPALRYGEGPVLRVALELAAGAVTGPVNLTAGRPEAEPAPSALDIPVAIGTLEAAGTLEGPNG